MHAGTKIEDYALIGDTHTAALISREGSLDWLCLPRFDSPACFAALLGTPEHGRWLITPRENSTTIRRRYRGDTLVLETCFDTPTGTVMVVDFMPPRDRDINVVRIIVGVKGTVRMKMALTLRGLPSEYVLGVPLAGYIASSIPSTSFSVFPCSG